VNAQLLALVANAVWWWLVGAV